MKYLKYIFITIMLISITQIYSVNGDSQKDKDSPRKHLLAGYDFSGVIMENGDVWIWGANESYQLGLNDNENRIYPIKQSGKIDSKNIAEVISTDGTTHILMNNGDVYRWGKGGPSQGALRTPTKIATNVKSVAHARVQALTNPHDAMAFVENGQVKVYGSSYQGQAGRGISGYGANEQCTNTYNVPLGQRRSVLTEGTIEACSTNSDWKTVKNGKPLTNIRMVEGSTSTRGFVAVTNNNEVYTWGQGYTAFARKNNNVSIESEIVKLAVGNKMYALTENGELWEWSGASGVPVKLDFKDVKDVHAQASTVMVLMENGDVYGRGSNRDGQLGDFGSAVSTFTKIEKNVNEIGLGSHHSLFENTKGQIFGQGWNGYRQLANENDGVKERFTKIPNLSNITHVSAEIYSTFSIENNKELSAWGDLKGGDFGSKTSSPRKIKTFDSDVVSLVSNKEITTILTGVLLENEKTYTWGHDYDNYDGHGGKRYSIGELKHNPNNAAYTPNVVDGITYVVKDKIDTSNDASMMKDIVTGMYGGTVINKKGELLSWGSNNGGLWGIGEDHLRIAGSRGVVPKISRAFIKVKSNDKFVSVAGESRTRLALDNAGFVQSWGHDRNRSLGRSGNKYLPMRISGLNNIKKISMGNSTGMALDEKNDLYSWGANGKGQVGDGTVSASKGIVNISSLSGVKFENIFSGRTSQFAITKSGDLYAWGDNRYGQLGIGGRFDRTSPRKVEGLPGPVKSVDNGEEHTVVLLENGDVYVAGADTFGQLGLGAERSTISYQEIPFPDYITLNTKDNIEKTMGENFSVDGFVTSVVPGNPLEVKYEVESSSGIVEKGKIMDTTSTLNNNKFNMDIKLDDKYSIGGYTINVTVKNKLSNIENTQSINFGVVDNIPPSKPEIETDDYDESEEWSNNEVLIEISDGVDHESGVNYTEYRINKENWIRYKGSLEVDIEGKIVIEARTVDNAGNIGQITTMNLNIDKTPPNVTLVPSTTEPTHENITIEINAEDEVSGVKSITYLGEDVVQNGDFKDGLNGWVEVGDGGKFEFDGDSVTLNDNSVNVNKIGQFFDSNIYNNSEGLIFYGKVSAKGKGELRMRIGGQVVGPSKMINNNQYEEIEFVLGDRMDDSFIVEKIGDGNIQINNIELFARKEIDETRKLEVMQNGTYTFIVVDNAENATVKSIKIDNIDKYTKLHKPTIDDFDTSEIQQDNVRVKTSISNLIVEDWRDNTEWSLQVHSSKLRSDEHEIPLLLNKVQSIDKTEGIGTPPSPSHTNKKILSSDKISVIGKNSSRGKHEVNFGDALETEVSPANFTGKYNSKITWELVIAP